MSNARALVVLAAIASMYVTTASSKPIAIATVKTSLGCKVVLIKEIAQQLQITNTTKGSVAAGTKVSYADDKGQGAGSFNLKSALAPGGITTYGSDGHPATAGQAQIANWNGCQASMSTPVIKQPNPAQ